MYKFFMYYFESVEDKREKGKVKHDLKIWRILQNIKRIG